MLIYKYNYNKVVQDFRGGVVLLPQLCFMRPKDDHTHQVISTIIYYI